MDRNPSWPFVLVGVLVLALAVLAHLQVQWINQVTEGSERRTRMDMDESAHRVTEDLTRELLRIVNAFELRDVDAAELARRYERWNATARDPRLVAAVFVMRPDDTLVRFDGHALVPVEWPPAFAGIRVMPRELFDAAIPAIVLPMHGPHGHAMLIVQIDARELYQVFAPDVALRQLHDFDFAIARGDQIVYRSTAGWPAGAHPRDADFMRPLFPERGACAEPPLLLVRHRGGPLAAVLASARRLHLAVAFGIMGLFAASLIILAMSVRRAERLRRQQLEFVAGVTHELHTPLAALASAGQNLADGIEVDTAKYGATIVKETRRLGDLLDDVLQFASIESRSIAARTADVDVREIVGEAVAQCQWLADEQHVQIESDAPESLPRMRADRVAITRAVQNLVANAIRHGREGGWVGVRAWAEDGHVAIAVRDRGPGIPAADLPHLFEPFYRGRNAQTRGSGLGLTIVQGVARAHDGSVHAANRREGGAEFTLRFPVQ